MSRRYERWQRRVLSASRRLDFWIPRVVVAGLILVVLSQISIRSPLVVNALGLTDQLELNRRLAHDQIFGLSVTSDYLPVSAEESGLYVTLELLEPKPSTAVKVLINGAIVGTFNQHILRIPVDIGDLLEIDCMHESKPVTVRVSEVSSAVGRPLAGQYLKAQSEIRPLAKISVK